MDVTLQLERASLLETRTTHASQALPVSSPETCSNNNGRLFCLSFLSCRLPKYRNAFDEFATSLLLSA